MLFSSLAQMVGDALDDATTDENTEEEENQVVNQVLDEIGIELKDNLVNAPQGKAQVTKAQMEDEKKLEARYNNLKNSS